MKPDVYAKAMFALTNAGKTADEIFSGVISSLKKRGALGLLPKILSAYERLVMKASHAGAVLTVARITDREAALKASGAQIDTEVKIDERIIGGYRLEKSGVLIDNSFKEQLLSVYRKALAE